MNLFKPCVRLVLVSTLALTTGGVFAQTGSAAQAEALPCPGPATEAALVAAAHAGASSERLIKWVTTCGVAFPVGVNGLERLKQAGVSANVVMATATGRYFYLLSNPSDEILGRILSLTPPGRVAPALSAAERAELTSTLDSPTVAAIRTLLDRYHSAKPLMTGQEDQRLAQLLDALPSDALTSPFMLLAVNPFPAGGETVTIMFAHPSHMVLDVQVADGAVSFLRQKPLSADARERIFAYYRDMVKDPALLR